MFIRLSLFLILLPLQLEAIKILLIIPKFACSHTAFVGHIADILVEAGFDVTVLLVEMNPIVTGNVSELAKRVILPVHPKILEHFKNSPSILQHTWRSSPAENFVKIIKITGKMADLFGVNCEHILTFDLELDRLRKENFDLAIAEAFDGCALGLIELLKIPAHVMVTPLPLSEHLSTVLGVPIFPSYVPNILSWFGDEMSYGERAINLLFVIMMRWFSIARVFARETEIFKHKFGDEFIDLSEKMAQASFVLSNADPFLDFPRPTIHKVVTLGSLSIREPKPLDEYWKLVMERRPKVILVSFGTVARSYLMPPELKRTILQSFHQFPDVTFIWKYEKDDDNVTQGFNNVVTAKWIPQNEILAHPNLIAFVTHAGINSIGEAAASGKPIIAIPLFGDQKRNAKMMERAGSAIYLKLDDIFIEGALADAIMAIINNNKYSMAAAELAQMIAKRPNPPKEQLIRHVKFAAEFGQLPNLDPYGRRMSFASYFMLDIIIPFVLAVFLACTGSLFLFYRFMKRMLSNSLQKSKKE